MQFRNVEEYIASLAKEKQLLLKEIREVIKNNILPGFSEVLSYNMPRYAVPHSIYPSGYRCTPKLPLPFINFAAQKNYISLTHMGLYADPELLKWFVLEYQKSSKNKLNMGKGLY